MDFGGSLRHRAKTGADTAGEADAAAGADAPSAPSAPSARWPWLTWIEDYLERTEEEAEGVEEADRGSGGGELSAIQMATRLKDAAARLAAACRPYGKAVDSWESLVHWESPRTTGLTAAAYFACVWYGCVLAGGALALLLLSLSTAPWEPESRSEAAEAMASDGSPGAKRRALFARVSKARADYRVAKAKGDELAHMLGNFAATLEKFTLLANGAVPENTAVVHRWLLAVVVVLLLLPWPLVETTLKLFLGYKVFVQSFFFHRYPRLRVRFDSTARFIRGLPDGPRFEAMRTAGAEPVDSGRPRSGAFAPEARPPPPPPDANVLLLAAAQRSGAAGRSVEPAPTAGAAPGLAAAAPPAEEVLASWAVSLVANGLGPGAMKSGTMVLSNRRLSFVCGSGEADSGSFTISLDAVTAVEQPTGAKLGGGRLLAAIKGRKSVTVSTADGAMFEFSLPKDGSDGAVGAIRAAAAAARPGSTSGEAEC